MTIEIMTSKATLKRRADYGEAELAMVPAELRPILDKLIDAVEGVETISAEISANRAAINAAKRAVEAAKVRVVSTAPRISHTDLVKAEAAFQRAEREVK